MLGPGREAYYSSHLAYYSKPFWQGRILWMVFLLLIPKYCIPILPGPYLVVITKKTLVGLIKGHEVWKIKGTDVLAFPRATLHLTEKQVCLPKNDKKCCGCWKNSGCFYVEISCGAVGSIVSQGVLGQACLVWQMMKKQAITISVCLFSWLLWLSSWWKNKQ